MANKEPEQTNMTQVSEKSGANKPWYKKKRIMIPLILVALIAFAAMGGDDSENNSPQASNETSTGTDVQVNEQSAETDESQTDDASSLTKPQQNAVRSAEAYIRMSGFSRQGLIDQLSSEYGDNYNVEDATVAVDSLDINYNEQAKRSAESYLDMSGFSCQGLIDQLSSDAGDKYTVEQARFGAEAAGAC